MSKKVYFVPAAEGDDALYEAVKRCITDEELLSFLKEKDMTALKTHFGETKKCGYVRPPFIKMIGAMIKEKGALPFLTETQTLYRGNRTNAVEHTEHAYRQGFDYESVGVPVIMADGLYGDEEVEVPIPGRMYRSVYIASLIAKAQSLVMVSHFTGHLAAGFGAALKNLGMGCASRKGKLIQHSTARPAVKEKKCTACGVCIKWCPQDAISMKGDSAFINEEQCIGCGQCLAVCRFDAVHFNWGATFEDLQKKIVEHALGAVQNKEKKSLYINFLTRVSKDCDCMDTAYEEIVPDIGVLLSKDPVACDAASIDLVEKKAGKSMQQLAYNIPTRFQIDYAEEIGFGTRDYRLINV